MLVDISVLQIPTPITYMRNRRKGRYSYEYDKEQKCSKEGHVYANSSCQVRGSRTAVVKCEVREQQLPSVRSANSSCQVWGPRTAVAKFVYTMARL